MLVGHNPGVADLATALTQPPDADVAPLSFPTAAAAVLEFSAPWSDLGPGQARLIDHTIPADLRLSHPLEGAIGCVAHRPR
jgi:phosphohistidine phosphatase